MVMNHSFEAVREGELETDEIKYKKGNDRGRETCPLSPYIYLYSSWIPPFEEGW